MADKRQAKYRSKKTGKVVTYATTNPRLERDPRYERVTEQTATKDATAKKTGTKKTAGS